MSSPLILMMVLAARPHGYSAPRLGPVAEFVRKLAERDPHGVAYGGRERGDGGVHDGHDGEANLVSGAGVVGVCGFDASLRCAQHGGGRAYGVKPRRSYRLVHDDSGDFRGVLAGLRGAG